ncbi:MAG: oligosaccharide flippase family protein [Chloroflexota bacterium]
MSLLRTLDRRLRGNVLAKLGSELIGRVATFGLSLLIANQLGERVFGAFNYGLALGFVLAQIADLGLQVLMARDVAVGGRRTQPSVRAALRLKLWLSVPVLLLLLLTTAGRPGEQRLSFLLLGLAMLAQTFLEFAAYVYRGQEKVLTEAWLLASGRLLTALVAVLALWGGAGLPGVALAYLLGAGSLALWGLWRLGREGWFGAEAAGSGTAPPYSQLLRQALPLGIAIFLSIGYTRLAIFLLEFRLGEVAVAQFSAAQRLVEPTQIVPAALLAAVFPAYSHALHHDPDQARRLALVSSLLLGAGGAALAVVFWLSAPWLVPFLYGQPFAEAVPVLQILGLSALPAYINYNLTHILIARGQQLYSSIFTGLMLLLHAVLTWQLIPGFGATAPAISVTFAELILLLCCTLTLLLTGPRQQTQLAGAPASE